MPDHVYLNEMFEPSTAPYKYLKAIKGRSSNLLRKEFPQLLKSPTLWTRSYFVSTLGQVSSDKVKEYITAQWNKTKK